tara:strand:+ start:66169 stop:66705 length:537 start_codon:yes stop_codon:yes gene_type:complete
MVEIKENIEDYLLLYSYTIKKGYPKITRIEMNTDRLPKVIVIIDEKHLRFGYERLMSLSIDTTTDSFKAFEREYAIDMILDETIELSNIKYQSMLCKMTNDYYTAHINYIKSLSIGDPVYYLNQRCVIYKPHRKQKRGRLDLRNTEDNNKIIKNVPLHKISLRRPLKMVKQISDAYIN